MELQVRAVSARNLLDKQTFGKQDPYCKLTLRGKSQRTRVHDNGRTCVCLSACLRHLSVDVSPVVVGTPDKTPVWNEKFTFAVVDAQLDQLIVEVKDKNFTSR